jgi:8-oxo-dGTP pyrophosphatase MutT (NUDIX family)
VIPHDDALRERLTANLAAHPVHAAAPGEHRHAAVAIVVVGSEEGSDLHDPLPFTAEQMSAVVPGDLAGFDGAMSGVAGGAAFLLCRRAAKLNRHGGQWALPGGRMDPGETPEDTARRELHEELGLDLPESAVIGRLDDYVTRSGYVMTPVVMWAPGDVVLQPDPGEVAHVYRIGLHHLQRPDSPRFITIPESDRPVVQVPIGGDLIHAPTGAVLVQFRWVAMEGRAGERVHDFEQPVFAWQ